MTNENPRGLPVVQKMLALTIDWDRSSMDNREPPRDGITCGDIRQLATDYAALQADLAAAIARAEELEAMNHQQAKNIMQQETARRDAETRAEAAEAKLAAMEQDAREIYAQIPGLPVTPETCDAVTDVLTRFCMDFNDAIAAQQAEGES